MDIITAFDRPVAIALQEEVASALQGIAERHGLTVGAARDSVRGGRIAFRVTFEVEGGQAAVDFRRLATSHGLDEADLYRTFDVDGHTWTIVGLDPGQRARPVLVRRGDNGKVHLADAESVRRALRGGPR